MNKRLYLAYGSNLNLEQMAHRCPTARPYKVGVVHNFKLVFRGQHGGAVATIEPTESEEDKVPVLLWEIQPPDERELDRYEGFPWLYRKENIPVEVEGETLEVMAYIMNEGKPIAEPSGVYYKTILQGYIDNEFYTKPLALALKDSEQYLK